jgi:predicted Zn-dependent protease
MMDERLGKLLARTPGVSDWKLVERRVEARELFFVGREPDMHRSKAVRHLGLTVYRDFEEGGTPYRGEVRISLHPEASPAELSRWIEQAVFAAGQVRNEPFPLVEPSGAQPAPPESRFSQRPLTEWLAPLSEALLDHEAVEGARVNSVELFLNHVETRILNSRGVDVSYSGFEGYVELIVEAAGPTGEVELYREIRFSDYEPDRLRAEVVSELELARDRAAAEPMPLLKRADVILRGEPVRELLRYYLTQSAAESIYNNISRFKAGDCLQGETVRGDRLTIRGEPYLPGSPASSPWDGDGFPLAGTAILQGGVLRRIWGSPRFCHYLGVEPTGALPNTRVEAGSRSLEEMRGGAALEAVVFSDFHSDPITGDFGGEVRLAYLLDGRRRRPVSGGSISGNLKALHGEMYLSREQERRGSFEGPRAVQLFGVSVTGVR